MSSPDRHLAAPVKSSDDADSAHKQSAPTAALPPCPNDDAIACKLKVDQLAVSPSTAALNRMMQSHIPAAAAQPTGQRSGTAFRPTADMPGASRGQAVVWTTRTDGPAAGAVAAALLCGMEQLAGQSGGSVASRTQQPDAESDVSGYRGQPSQVQMYHV
ncbi:hypothetical protein WJX84_005317 [Apatococcus fuscideae]|uniref:Uncharacterized protein n=1 Tax=Apatococcus fuscideae TaxID=2026836 RepID=A0AAW1S5W5_9CHLO